MANIIGNIILSLTNFVPKIIPIIDNIVGIANNTKLYISLDSITGFINRP